MPLVRPNISIIGPPGSGKGSYGRLVAESTPFVIASTLLENAKLDTSSGKLLNDVTVSNTMVQNLPKNPPYFVDGFPRTMNQVKLMERDWSKDMQVHAAISLEVPREVCFQKLMGRRFCEICERQWNTSDVHHDQFVMPPNLPASGCDRCSESDDWTQRPDDKPEIIDERLDIFYETTAPILEHYEQKGMLLRFAPYKGFDDVPRFKSTMAAWLEGL